MRFFVDGKLVGRQALKLDPLAIPTTDAMIGFAKNGFVGQIDEVRISKIARYSQDFAPAARFQPDADTLALYHMDEGQGDELKDSSGNNHHGKIVGAKWVKVSVPPPASAVLMFDGTGQVSLPASLKVDPRKPYTLEAYATPSELSNVTQTVVAANENSGIFLQRASGFWRAQAHSAEFSALSLEPAALNRKVHLAAVFKDKQIHLYVDGQLARVSEIESDPPAKAATSKFYVSKAVEPFHGTIAEVRISGVARYDKNFTPAERFVPDKDTIALYHMDEGEGDVLKDSSGNGHDGKITGAKWVKATATPPADAPAKFALGFEGNGKVVVPNLELTADGPRTYEAYVLALDRSTLLGRFRHTQLMISDKRQLQFYVLSTTGAVRVQGAEVPAGRYVHIAGVVSNGEARLYMDGKLVGRGMLKDPLLADTSGIWQIGDDRFVGQLREIRVSNAARYDKDFTPDRRFNPDKDTVALYHCDEGEGDTLKDSSGNNHHGKITGAKWVKGDGASVNPATHPQQSKFALQFEANRPNEPWHTVDFPSFKADFFAPRTFEGYITPMSTTGASLVGWDDLFSINATKGMWSFDFRGIDPAGKVVRVPVASSIPITQGKKSHVALVFTGRQFRLFVDGKLAIAKDVGDLTFDKRKGPLALAYNFTGQITEIRASNVARYEDAFTPQMRFEADKDTLALYHFDEGEGNILKDSSGNNHHGKIIGAKWVKAEGSSVAPPNTGLSSFDKLRREDISAAKFKNAGYADTAKAPKEIVAIFDAGDDKGQNIVQEIALSPNDEMLALVSPDGVDFIEVANGKQRRGVIRGAHRYSTFSRDGKLLAATTFNRANLYDVATGKIFQTLCDHSASATFGPGDREVYFSSTPLQRRIVAEGAPILKDQPSFLEGGDLKVGVPTLNPDGTRLAGSLQAPGAVSTKAYSLKMWDPKSGKLIATLYENYRAPAYVRFSSDGRSLIYNSLYGHHVRVHDGATGEPLHIYRGHEGRTNTDAAFSPDGRLVASCDDQGSVRIWEAATGETKRTLELKLPGPDGKDAPIRQILFAPDGRHLLIRTEGGTVYVLRLAEPPQRRQKNNRSKVRSTFSTPSRFP